MQRTSPEVETPQRWWVPHQLGRLWGLAEPGRFRRRSWPSYERLWLSEPEGFYAIGPGEHRRTTLLIHDPRWESRLTRQFDLLVMYRAHDIWKHEFVLPLTASPHQPRVSAREIETFDRLMRLGLERIAYEATDIPTTPRVIAFEGHEPLLQASELVLEGLSESELAALLFVSEAFVETVMETINKRFGISSRAELARRLRG